MTEKLEAIKCPSMRYRFGKGEVLCNGLVIVGQHYGYCPKCSVFYEIDHLSDGEIVIKKIDKCLIEIKWLIFRFEK
jgi:hypothetical protein